jgi:hypothetical protein
VRVPGTSKVEWVPIEDRFRLDEKEINKLLARAAGNQQLLRDLIRVSVPQRTDDLVTSNSRRIEVDFFTAWLLSQITQKNPDTGATQTIPLGFDATRYEVAATPWNDNSVNAYDLALGFARRAILGIGPIAGLGCRMHHAMAIQADAPPAANTGYRLTLREVADRISQETGSAFDFFMHEQTVDVFTDGGIATVRQPVWVDDRVAAIPADERIGNTLFAPVLRAYDISDVAPKAKIDVRGMTVYHEPMNGGRGLQVECQVNALPFPDESRIYVADVGF